MSVLYVALGGAIGSAARYLAGLWIAAYLGASFPWGTFFVNVTGSFLIGIVLVLVEAGTLPAEARLFLAVGILERVMNSAEKPHQDADSAVSSVHRRSPVFRIRKPFLSKFITRSKGVRQKLSLADRRSTVFLLRS